MDVIDFHSHILPYADHGSSSIDVSMAQLTLALEHGVKRIILTPHYYPHRENPDNFISRRERCYKKLLENLTAELPDVRLGAEVLVCDNIEEIPGIDNLCIRGTKILLLELPFSDFSKSYITSVKSLISEGYQVVLAHADRYDPRDIDSLILVGAKIQLNADAFSTLFLSKHIRRWLSDGHVCAIGSDIHGADKNAYKRFIKAINKIKDLGNILEFSDTVWKSSSV